MKREDSEQFGAILADEMGLGKTLALIYTLKNQGPYGQPIVKRVLTVTPSSLVDNWDREITKWLKQERIFTFIVGPNSKLKKYAHLFATQRVVAWGEKGEEGRAEASQTSLAPSAMNICTSYWPASFRFLNLSLYVVGSTTASINFWICLSNPPMSEYCSVGRKCLQDEVRVLVYAHQIARLEFLWINQAKHGQKLSQEAGKRPPSARKGSTSWYVWPPNPRSILCKPLWKQEGLCAPSGRQQLCLCVVIDAAPFHQWYENHYLQPQDKKRDLKAS
ncbi:ribosomal protein S8 [Culex quinquefasciatus]|uniref:Ribosomal protein S8 n=1 Tax=Culex quinquefasciatus TaxID=7176 RepID=B0X337_CULQU|nr:ribosomal protein S8 [Culex quinquefasciatus]|eukprot:XP_001864059.1 ribosomal protein S8 [Culex quinquefasciatus]